MGEIKSFLEVKMQIMLHNIHFLDEKEWINGSEIIVVSGGSTDKTNEILETYMEIVEKLKK